MSAVIYVNRFSRTEDGHLCGIPPSILHSGLITYGVLCTLARKGYLSSVKLYEDKDEDEGGDVRYLTPSKLKEIESYTQNQIKLLSNTPTVADLYGWENVLLAIKYKQSLVSPAPENDLITLSY